MQHTIRDPNRTGLSQNPRILSGTGNRSVVVSRVWRQPDISSARRPIIITLNASILAVMLSGCAGANLRSVAETPEDAPVTPLVVIVQHQQPVVAASGKPGTPIAAGQAQASASEQPDPNGKPTSVDPYIFNVAALEQGLATRLEHNHIVATAGSAGSHQPSDLTLIVDLETIRPGNAWARNLVGLGWGQSRLAAKVQLFDPRQTPPRRLLTFEVRANSGSMPGLVLSPGPVALVVKSGVLVTNQITSTGHENADRAASAIVKRLASYYRSRGWLETASSAHGVQS